MAISHWFLPHPETHKKAHLISWHGLVIYILLLILLQVSFSIVNFAKPGVLGINSNIDQKRLIELTNQERAKYNLPSVSENSNLDKAAAAKAANMFEENYWAHFAPSGKSPWDFILGSGYKFQFAGENLAKNYYSSEEVVQAWMNSPTHKENLMNPKYKEIGMAVVEGNLNGQKTTLVVQMFGTNLSDALAIKPSVEISGKKINLSAKQYDSVPELFASVKAEKIEQALIDPYKLYKAIGTGVLGFAALLLLADFLVLKRRGVLRPSSHHFANMSFLAVGMVNIIMTGPGSVL